MDIKDRDDWVYKGFPQARRAATLVYNRMRHLGWIKWFRNTWNLPPEGFHSESTFQKWYVEITDKAIDNLQSSKNLKKKAVAELLLKKPRIKFEEDVMLVIRELKIPDRYSLFVRSSLTCKGMPVDFPLDRSKPILELRFDNMTGRQKLFIEVFSDTKIRDFNNAIFKDELKTLQKKLPDYGIIKQIQSKKIALWEQVYQWKMEGKSYKKIKGLAGEKLGHTFNTLEEVGVCLRRYKAMLRAGTRKIEK